MDKKTILIVEDDLALLRALHQKLISEGFNVIEAKDGKTGLEIALQKQPDLILLDIVMPIMDGMSMLEELRKDKWGEKVPIVILTNLSSPDNFSTALKHKVFDYLVKANWTLQDVVNKVKERLGMTL
jgi:DNA-binding response OmpR family regulator